MVSPSSDSPLANSDSVTSTSQRNSEINHPSLLPNNTNNSLCHMHNNVLYGKLLQNGKPNYLTDYALSYQDCTCPDISQKCWRATNQVPPLGRFYAISKSIKDNANGTISANAEERTYDEPYSGDGFPPRSWLCCPGSKPDQTDHQPALITKYNTLPANGTIISQAVVHQPSKKHTCSYRCEKLQQQLDEQAQRYEQELTELHSVIAELSRKLQQQRCLAITEEDEISESCTSIHEDSITCPLEVSELDILDHENLSDVDNKTHDSPIDQPQPEHASSSHHNNKPHPETSQEDKNKSKTLQEQIEILHLKLAEANAEILRLSKTKNIAPINGFSASSKQKDVPTVTVDDPQESPCQLRKYADPKSITHCWPLTTTDIPKVAERVKLKLSTEDADESQDLVKQPEVSDALSNIPEEEDVWSQSRPTDASSGHDHSTNEDCKGVDRVESNNETDECQVDFQCQQLYVELSRTSAKLEHARAQNTLLNITLTETKAHCDRIAMLCGKYESNAIALRLALGISDRTIEAYDVLLALLETELSAIRNSNDNDANRQASETVAKQLLNYLDNHNTSTEILHSPWQKRHLGEDVKNEPWTEEHETRLRAHVSNLKAERSSIQNTCVELEPLQIESPPMHHRSLSTSQDARKMDLEVAVLIQELMALREEKTELFAKLFHMEREKMTLDLQLKYMETRHKAQSATLQHVQSQLKDTETLLAAATQTKERGNSDAEHAQGVELELMGALAREARLKVRLHDLAATLEQVTKSAEARILEGRDIFLQDLNQTSSVRQEKPITRKNHHKYREASTARYFKTIMSTPNENDDTSVNQNQNGEDKSL